MHYNSVSLRGPVNITDVKDQTKFPEDIWKAIFEKQWELALKYSEIEGMGDLLKTTSNNIDTAKGQRWIKDFSWRVTEELAETQEAYTEWRRTKEEACLTHYWEEMTDALHFLVELTLIAGYKSDFVPKATAVWLETKSWDVVYSLGLMCNTLKNKLWKQTQLLTDRNLFEFYLRQTWLYFISIFVNEHLSKEDIYNLYFKKNQVNQFRIRSKY